MQMPRSPPSCQLKIWFLGLKNIGNSPPAPLTSLLIQPIFTTSTNSNYAQKAPDYSHRITHSLKTHQLLSQSKFQTQQRVPNTRSLAFSDTKQQTNRNQTKINK